MSQQTPSAQDLLKLSVAQAALEYIQPKLQADDIIGIGTGSTANYFIDLLASVKSQFKGAVASSEASASRLRAHAIPILELNDIDSLCVYVDGADESNAQLELIKGGGAALTREKIVASCAHEFVCIADESKWVNVLGEFPLPIEVLPMALTSVQRQLNELGGEAIHRAGVMTDNGGIILDIHGLKIHDPKALESSINQIPGVVTNGLFAQQAADILFLGTASGIKTFRAN